ncbi:triose-phosphate isomerase [Chitinimonas sp.]|uniref:triose-phosphate isomerase n=1 Tax=Chitinimonas sp. TaxID=1934313 RepID=UPI002F953459
MRRKLLIGNWKMNGSLELARQMAARLMPMVRPEVALWLCPSALHATGLAQLAADSGLGWGMQDISAQPDGARTGEHSVRMAGELGARCAIVGHSERRAYHGETDQLVADKARACLEGGLLPVVCLGERMEERAAGQTDAVLARQLAPVLASVPSEDWYRLVIAYEPVWAIGSGQAAGSAEIAAAHAGIRRLIDQAAPGLGDKVSVLYGGSLCAGNAAAVFSTPGVDGGLAGGASLRPGEFADIYQLALQYLGEQ